MSEVSKGFDNGRSVRKGPRYVASLVTVVVIAAVIAFAAPTADAGDGAPSALGVQPVEVSLGGQPNDCTAAVTGRLPSAATYELRIENPQDGVTYAGPAGVSFTLAVTSDDKHVDFTLNGAAVVYDVIIKGGQKSAHFDYDTNGGPGGVTADQNLHAPTKGNGSNLFSVSHMSICYEDAFPASGTVYVDANQNGALDSGEVADAPRVITAYGATASTSTTSAADGSYTLFLQAGGTYTICEEAIADFVQTAPNNTVCNALGSSEQGGHSVANLTAAVAGLDFGNAPEICGQTLQEDGVVFDGTFELFEQGNSESGCDDKIGQLFESEVQGERQLNLPLTGNGEVAGIGIITKTFPSTAFVPLQYAQTLTDDFEVMPWCALRVKEAGDGTQFDPFLNDVSMYPSLVGITDPVSGDASVSCKVSENETADGIQVTVVLIQDDPFWK